MVVDATAQGGEKRAGRRDVVGRAELVGHPTAARDVVVVGRRIGTTGHFVFIAESISICVRAGGVVNNHTDVVDVELLPGHTQLLDIAADDDLAGNYIRNRELVGGNFGIADDGQQGALYFKTHADLLIFTVPVSAVHDFFGKSIDMAGLRLSASARKTALL